jgi:transposase
MRWSAAGQLEQTAVQQYGYGENVLKIKTIGIDLGKSIFHIVGMDERGSVVLKRKLSRTQLFTFLANTPTCLIGMEASCGAHHIAREAAVYGHEMRLIPAQFVRPFVKSQKNDYVDAEAIAEAVQRPTMRFVPVKTTDQLDLQAIHRVRDRLIERRTSVINQFRAFLLERGIVFRAGRQHLFKALSSLLAENESKLSPIMFRLLAIMVDEWRQIEGDVERLNQEIACIVERDVACQRLLEVPGAPFSVVRRSVKAIAVPCSSPSISNMSRCPRASAIARLTARVVFPTPPFTFPTTKIIGFAPIAL